MVVSNCSSKTKSSTSRSHTHMSHVDLLRRGGLVGLVLVVMKGCSNTCSGVILSSGSRWSIPFNRSTKAWPAPWWASPCSQPNTSSSERISVPEVFSSASERTCIDLPRVKRMLRSYREEREHRISHIINPFWPEKWFYRCSTSFFLKISCQGPSKPSVYGCQPPSENI